MKPFLLVSARPEEAAADNEYQAFLAFCGLGGDDLVRWPLVQRPLGAVDLASWSGIFLGGSPFNWSDPAEVKSGTQHRVEADLLGLLDQVVGADFPFLGACYGIGALGSHQGAVVDRGFGEAVGAVTVTLTRQGREDDVMGVLPPAFEAFVGHKEAISRLPAGAVRLAGSACCPVQAFRVGHNVYATQFHPELDAPGLSARVEVYKYAGYFEPAQIVQIKAMAQKSLVEHPPAMLKRFVQRYAAAREGRPGSAA